ncbi:MAG: hypothetical protein BA863_18235 [Desulfovibrio sp. S3730MH75]|nr:MAG: hypothetical protein BA863_18235 [Desulfovibrio sp. S3730MH75]
MNDLMIPRPRWKQQPRRVLVLSSSESLPVARAVQTELNCEGIEPTVWDQSNFSGWLLQDIVTAIADFAFVVVVVSADDHIKSRGIQNPSPRDNVILELGMAIAMNGVCRTAVLCTDSPTVKLPIDIEGLVVKRYFTRTDGNVRAAVAPACSEILDAFDREAASGVVMPPGLFYQALEDLNYRLFKKNRQRVDIVIGVNHGGAILGSKLYYMNRQLFHFTVFWIDVYSNLRSRLDRHADAEQELATLLSSHEVSKGSKPNIVLVDDTLRSGRAMVPAMHIVSKLAPEAILRIGCMIYRPDMASEYEPGDFKDVVITPDPKRFSTGSFDRIFYER